MKKPEIEKRPGVYMITNLVNGHRYIGSSVNVYNRLCRHKRLLKHGNHYNKHLQNAYDKYGAENFTAQALLYCEREETTGREQEFLDSLKPEYNIATNATMPTLGRSLSAETRAKIGEKSKQMWQDEEYRAKKSEAAIAALRERMNNPEALAECTDRYRERGKRHSEALKRRWEERKKELQDA